MGVPKREWGAKAEEMPGAVGEFARLTKAYKGQIVFSMRHVPSDDAGALWLFPHRLRFQISDTKDYQDLIDQALNSDIKMVGQPMPEKLYVLVCTHGKRDIACAKDGSAVVSALGLQAPPYVEVWDVSHLGGHRFAGTLVVQPLAHWYGFVLPEDVGRLLEALQRGTILPDLFRGSAHFEPPFQVADKWAWEQLQARGIFGSMGDIHLMNPKIAGHRAQVDVQLRMGGQIEHHHLELSATPYSFIANSNSDVTKDRLIWQIDD